MHVPISNISHECGDVKHNKNNGCKVKPYGFTKRNVKALFSLSAKT